MSESEDDINKSTEIRHLLRTVKTALELAIVARAPVDLINRLGRASGLLDAVSQLPLDGGPAQAMAVGLVERGADRVIAMLAAVTDGYATQLARRFYRELAARPLDRITWRSARRQGLSRRSP